MKKLSEKKIKIVNADDNKKLLDVLKDVSTPYHKQAKQIMLSSGLADALKEVCMESDNGIIVFPKSFIHEYTGTKRISAKTLERLFNEQFKDIIWKFGVTGSGVNQKFKCKIVEEA